MIFNRPLSWAEWIQWVLVNQPERIGFAPNGCELRQPPAKRGAR
jgi:hypothetical protein